MVQTRESDEDLDGDDECYVSVEASNLKGFEPAGVKDSIYTGAETVGLCIFRIFFIFEKTCTV